MPCMVKNSDNKKARKVRKKHTVHVSARVVTGGPFTGGHFTCELLLYDVFTCRSLLVGLLLVGLLLMSLLVCLFW